MVSLKDASWIMEHTWAYRLWQAPFLEQKFAPIRRHNDLTSIRRVLDVGCGPGSNCEFFTQQDYLGVDINPAYIEFARRRYGREFQVADATQLTPDPSHPFDMVLMNSLLHHLTDEQVRTMLRQLGRVVDPSGCIHVIDLVLPSQRGLPRYLALNDRGDFSRPLEAWRELFEAAFETVVFEPFSVSYCGVRLWELVYFKGNAK